MNTLLKIVCLNFILIIGSSFVVAQDSINVPTIKLEEIKPQVELVSQKTLNGLTQALIADTNHDGIQDLIAVVELDQQNSRGISYIKNTPNLKIQYLCSPGDDCCDETEFTSPALLIIHGRKKGWEKLGIKNFTVLNSILFRGRTNIGAFQRDRLKTDGIKLIDIYKDRKGTGVKLGTEASEGLLQFVRGKYTYYETEP